MSNKLREITYLTVKNLKNYDIILPAKYSTTFEDMAKKLQVDFNDEDIVLKDLNHDVEYVNKIVDKTNDSLNHLEKSTISAQKAIQDKNELGLKAIYTELAEMKIQINSLQRQLFSDPLTGAYNRKWFSDQYLIEENFQHDGFIAFLDLNKFKVINDNYGHLVGDQVLKYLVRFLKNELNYPGVDIIRYAGDEFLILFNKERIRMQHAEELIKEAQIKLAKQKLKSSKIDELQFSFSYGFSSFSKGEHMEKVLNVVDELMYKNKEETTR